MKGFFLAALLFSPAWGSVTPQPGTVNYIEGHAAIGPQALTDKSVGSAKMEAGQLLSTTSGRAEILLTPGIFLRVGDNSSLRMVQPGLADTITTLEKGRAMVEVDEIHPANNVRVGVSGVSVQLQKAGLYDFDADRGMIRVFDGEAVVRAADRTIELKRGHELALKATGKLKTRRFDVKESADDFYRWASLRSSYLAEANVDAAQAYAGVGGSGWYPGGWYGDGWYWDPWFDAFTFIPGDGIFFDPFGWGFYSPWFVPYVGFGYGYGGYGYGGYGYGYGGGYGYRRLPTVRHFGPGYRPPTWAAGGRPVGSVGRAYSVRGGSAAAFSRGGGFIGGSRSAGSFSSGGGGVRSGGGGFSGGGGGGGFRGGGGGGSRGGGGGGGSHGGGGGGHGR